MKMFPQWLIGLLFRVAVACIKTASSLGQAHNELPVQIGNPSQLSGNEQWLVDNGGLVELSSSCSYIRTTGTCSVCPGKMRRGTFLWLLGEVWEQDAPTINFRSRKRCCMYMLFHYNYKGIQQLRYMWLELHSKANKVAKNKYTFYRC